MPAYRRFLDACRFVNIKQVNSIIDEVGEIHLGTLVLFRDNVGRTPLMYIVDGPEDQFHHDRNEITSLLLKHLSNQDVNMTDYVGNTALHYVCHHGNIPLLNLLLRYEANINMINNDGESCVTVAARGGYTNCIALLLSSYQSISSPSSSSPSSSLVSKSSSSSSPISVSSYNEVNRTDKSIEGDNDDNETPIVIYGSTKILICVTQKLMELINKRSKYGIALYVAIQFDHYDTADLLLKCRSKVNSKSVSSDGMTCLMQAVMNGSMNMVALLLQYDADVMLKDKYGMSCLYKAAIKGHINIMMMLRDYICITKHQEQQQQPEEEEEKGKAIFTSILNEQDYIYKETMLMKAARLGYRDIVTLLLDWGADVLIRNNSNNDAVHNARTVEIKTLLQAAVVIAKKKKQQQQQQQQPHKVVRRKNRPSNTAASIIIDDRSTSISTIVSINTTLNHKSRHHHHHPSLQDKKYDVNIHKSIKNNSDNNNIDKLEKGDVRKLDVYKKDNSVFESSEKISYSVKVNLRMTNNSSFSNKNYDNHDETEKGSHQNQRSNDHCNDYNKNDLSIQNHHHHDYQHSYICTSLSNLMLQRDEMDILQSIYTQDELLIITPSPDNLGDLSPVLLFKINSFLSSPSSLSGSLSLRFTMPDGYPLSTCIEVEVIIQDISMMDFTFVRREQLCEILVSLVILFLSFALT
jgi:ankyrin repeat protein